MIPPAIEQFWERVPKDGWYASHFHGTGLYPLPGEPEFDIDELFAQVPLFPDVGENFVVRVSDDKWPMPLSWCREYETRPSSLLSQSFKLPASDDVALRSSLLLNFKRCIYLELFRPRRPSALSTIKFRRVLYRKFFMFALRLGKVPSEIDFADLGDFVSTLAKAEAARIPSIYETLRWWRGVAPQSYSMFEPPPSVAAVEAGILHPGLDLDNIRDEVERASNDEGVMFQPLPDAFVAAAGEFCLTVLDELRPVVNSTIENLRALGTERTDQQERDVIESHLWPASVKVRNVTDVGVAASLCQTASIFVLSLMLGPRWSEVSALPRDAVITRSEGGTDLYFLDGRNFKYSQSLSGDARDWPIHPMLARYLEDQSRYIDVAEGPDFRFMWRSNASLWGGGQPKRQIHSNLTDFAERYGFAHLLEGSSFHHHRFRKTTARLIVIALHGGPMVLRRLFGHEHIGITLRYILANDGILDDLRRIAEEEQRALASTFVERRAELKGGGASVFQAAVESVVQELDLYTPGGKREQGAVRTEDILDYIADGADGLSIKQLLPGLIGCFKPPQEAGRCCKVGELANLSKCDTGCGWHLELPEFASTARINIADALTHLSKLKPSDLAWTHYAGIIRHRLRDFPELRAEFSSNPLMFYFWEDAGGSDRS